MIVDLSFRITGTRILADHGYFLYSAITSALPRLHASPDYSIHPIRGRNMPHRLLELTQASRRTFRLDHELIPKVMPLGGTTLCLGSQFLAVGAPACVPLNPCPALQSRLVVIKGYTGPEGFLAAVRRKVAEQGCNAEAELEHARSSARFEGMFAPSNGIVRRTLRIAQRETVGFPVRLSGLSDVDSVRLQETGIGGRQRFGCGVLLPVQGLRDV